MVAQPTAKYSASPLSDGEYHKLSNQAIDSLTETFETLLEDADVDALEQEARSNMQGASRGSPSSEWDIECAVSISPRLRRLIRCDRQAPSLSTHR
jgi:frataxin